MRKILVIGNGESRQGVDLTTWDFKIGCNAIVRDMYVNHLVCVDKRMVMECLEYHRDNYDSIYTRSDWLDYFNVKEVPQLPYKGDKRWDEPFQWGSGPYAILLATEFSDDINLIGFDLYSKTSTVNNVYKNTENYDKDDKRPVDPRYWIHQISMVFECFPTKKFTIFQEPNWELPEAWIKHNVTLDSISNISYNT